jgi:hypothetical protein
LLRIARRIALFNDDSLYEAIFKAALGRFLPSLARQVLEKLLVDSNLTPPKSQDISQLKVIYLFYDEPSKGAKTDYAEPSVKSYKMKKACRRYELVIVSDVKHDGGDMLELKYCFVYSHISSSH